MASAASAQPRVLDQTLTQYLQKLPAENRLAATVFPSLTHRFPGLEGSQLTDLALYLFAKNEQATYRIVEFQADGVIIELTDRHWMNTRKNPKGRGRYKVLFLKGGYAAFTSGMMVGMRNSAKSDPKFKAMISGGTRTVSFYLVCSVVPLFDVSTNHKHIFDLWGMGWGIGKVWRFGQTCLF